MVINALFLLIIAFMFVYVAVKKEKNTEKKIFSLLSVFFIINCAATLAVSSLYSTLVSIYHPYILVDINHISNIFHISITPWAASRIYNITVAFFLFTCVLSVFFTSRRKIVYIPMLLMIFAFLHINDYTTSWSIYVYINTHNLPALNFLSKNIAYLNYALISIFMFISTFSVINTAKHTKLKFKKKYYYIFAVCSLLVYIYYFLVLNVFFKTISYPNISFSKLPINLFVHTSSRAAVYFGFFIIILIIFITIFFPYEKILIISKRAQVTYAKDTSNNLNMTLHIYKNAFSSIDRMASTIIENLECGNDEIIYACAKNLNNISKEQMQIINKTLSLTRIENLDFTVLNLIEVINSAVKEMEIPSNVALSFSHKMSDIYIRGDVYYLKETFKNLIINAIDALYKVDRNDKKINIACYTDDKYAVTEIHDNGCGINKKDLGNIFELYFSSKSKKDCGGIGLYFVRNIINMHSGYIDVSSTPGTDTNFTVILPIT